MIPSALVVGYGSIGARHARILKELEVNVAVVSRRGGSGMIPDLAEGLAVQTPDYVVVATETSDHGRVLDQLVALDFRGRVLIEKPLFAAPRPLPCYRFAALAVGYNLRFHPALRRLADLLAETRILSAQLYVGQYLPDWRPGRDYRTLYSARLNEGGGVLRDLSHELDVAIWLFGPWQRVAALGGHWSPLEIDSDDVFLLLASFMRCPAVTIQVNYLDRRVRRDLVINTEDHTFSVDLIAGTLTRDREPPELLAPPRDAMYRALHQAMLTDASDVCNVQDGLAVVALIAAAEQAARTEIWQSSPGFGLL